MKLVNFLILFIFFMLSNFLIGCVANSTKGASGNGSSSAVNKVQTQDVTASVNEDTTVEVILKYTSEDKDNASSCTVSSLNNLIVKQACSCDSAGECKVSLQGSSNYNGKATFRYQVTAGGIDSTVSTGTVTIAAVADDPTVANVTLGDLIFEDVTSSLIYLNYSDPDGDRAGSSDCSITDETNITVTTSCTCDPILGKCSLKVKGLSDYYGPASFKYSVRTNGTWSNIATASLNIISVDDAPTANDITPASFNEDTTSIITLSYTDPENDKASMCTVSNLTNITISQACICSNGTCTVGVKGTSNYNGSASFTYTVKTNTITSNSATATLTIDPVDDAPIANNFTAPSFNEDVQSIIVLSYSDPENDLGTSCNVSNVVNGTITQACACDGSGVCSVGITGNSNYSGAGSFNFNITANGATSNNATATLNILAVNDAPVISSISNKYTAQNAAITVNFTISDVDNTLTCSGAMSGTSSSTSLVANSSIVFSGTAPNCSAVITPVAGQSGTTTISLSASDGTVSSISSFDLIVRAAVAKTWLMGDPSDTDTYAFSSANIAKTTAGVAYLVPTQLNQTHTNLADFPSFPSGLTWDGVNSVVKRSEYMTAPFNETYTSATFDGLKSTSWNSLTYSTGIPVGKGLPDFSANALIALEETSGNLTEKYNGIVFTVTGTPTYATTAKVGKGITFASAPYFETAYNANLNPTKQFSVCAWVKPAAIGAGYKSFFTSRDTNKGYALYVNNKFEFWIGNGTSFTQLVGTSTPSTSAYTYVCGMYDGTTASLVVNGTVETTSTTAFSPNTAKPSRVGAGKTETTATEFFNGVIDEISIHNRALTSTELTALSASTPTKALPQSTTATLANHLFNQETTANYPLMASSTLLSNLVSLWHFDDALGSTKIRNSANKTLSAFTGSLSIGVAGKIGTAASFDGSTSFFTSTNSVSTNVSTSAFTISAWIKTTSANNEQIISYSAAHSPLGINGGKLQFTLSSVTTAGTATINDGNWHHVVVSGSGTTCKVYLDGNTTTADITYTCAATSMGTIASVGRLYGTASNYYKGMLDEVAVWTRALSTTEIQQLYRRGANTLTVDVRSCAQSDCSDGTYTTTAFTEISNKDSLGNIYATPPVFNFTVPDNRYLQYKMIFHSDVAATAPELKKVIAGPNHYSYPVSDEYIVPQSALSFKTLSSLVESLGTAGCASGVRYQLSSDKVNWKYFNGSAWVTGIDYSTANTLATLNSGLSLYTSASPTVSDSVYIRAYLKSNLANECELNQLILNGNN